MQVKTNYLATNVVLLADASNNLVEVLDGSLKFVAVPITAKTDSGVTVCCTCILPDRLPAPRTEGVNTLVRLI